MFKATREGAQGKASGRTPLMFAASNRSSKSIDVLFHAGADHNVVNSAKRTALCYALKSKDLEIIGE